MNNSMALVAGILLTAATVAWLVATSDLGDVAEALGAAAPVPIVWAVIAQAASQLFRAFRLEAARNQRPHRVGRSMRVVIYQTALNHILPAKLGELALVALLRHQHGIGISTGTGIMFVLRGMDLFVLVAVGLIATGIAVGEATVAGIGAKAFLVTGLLLLVAPALFYALRPGRLLHRLEPRLARGRLGKFVHEMLDVVLALPFRVFLTIWLLTLAIWANLFAAAVLCYAAVTAAVPAVVAIAAMAGGGLAFALPVNGIANVGPFEAAWTFVARTLGAAPEAALAAGVLVHLVAVLTSLALLAICLAVPLVRRRSAV